VALAERGERGPFFWRALNEPSRTCWMDEHFTADGTLIETQASHKSFRRKNGNPRTAAESASVGRSVVGTATKRCRDK
jgi:hypothetical protein